LDKKQIIGLSAAGLSLIAAGGFLAGGAYLYRLSLKPGTSLPRGTGEPVTPVSEGPRQLLRNSRRWLEQNSELLHPRILSRDGLSLHALYLPSLSHRWALCVHGYRDSSLDMGFYASHYADQGWNVLLPDLRGHGMSQGDYVGMGWLDRLDLLDWLEWILRRDPQAQVLLHGISMGASAVLMATGEPLPPQVKAAVSDCAYTSAQEQFRHVGEAQLKLPLPAPLMLSSLGLVGRLKTGYWLRQASALKQVAKSATPTLFIHGTEDHFVPVEMAQRLYCAAACKEKSLLLVPGAGHILSAPTDPVLYWETIDAFLAPLFLPT
jgi:fermentation-respiration switch protein FrsA (DUF1100 family)